MRGSLKRFGPPRYRLVACTKHYTCLANIISPIHLSFSVFAASTCSQAHGQRWRQLHRRRCLTSYHDAQNHLTSSIAAMKPTMLLLLPVLDGGSAEGKHGERTRHNQFCGPW